MKLKEKYILILILLLAAFMAYIPHRNYDYPVHVDEWVHLTWAKAVVKAENAIYTDPFLGEAIVTENLEIGLHVWLASFKLITGISWWLIFKYFPVLISILLVLSVYIFASRLGYGLEAAFFASLIPTTVRLLGPGFLVAVSLGLIFISISLFLAFNAKHKFYYTALFFVSLFLLYLHPPTALASFIILTPFIFASRDWKIVISIALASFVASHRFISYADIESVQFSALAYFNEIFKEFGYIPTIFFVIGIFFLGSKRKNDTSLIFSSIILLLINLIYRRIGWAPLLMPTRNYLYIFLLMSIIAGHGLSKIKKKRIVLIGVVSLITFISYQSHINTPYYYIITDQEFEDFAWIKENVHFDKAVLNPWKANAFVAVAEKNVYSRIPQGPDKFYKDRNEELAKFFQNNCTDSTFLRENNISIVYTPVKCDNTELKEVKDRIYLFL